LPFHLAAEGDPPFFDFDRDLAGRNRGVPVNDLRSSVGNLVVVVLLLARVAYLDLFGDATDALDALDGALGAIFSA